MNLRVDLILETEQRSASVISMKALIRITTIVIPVLLGLLVAAQVVKLMSLKSELSALESRWQTMEPLEKKALQLGETTQANSDLLAQFDGWKKSHMDWHRQLAELVKLVPENIQLVDFRLSQSLQIIEDRLPARVFTLELKRKSLGPQAESSVKGLERDLLGNSFFSNYVQKVEVPMYGADTAPGAGKDDRIFEIRCSYREQKFE